MNSAVCCVLPDISHQPQCGSLTSRQRAQPASLYWEHTEMGLVLIWGGVRFRKLGSGTYFVKVESKLNKWFWGAGLTDFWLSIMMFSLSLSISIWSTWSGTDLVKSPMKWDLSGDSSTIWKFDKLTKKDKCTKLLISRSYFLSCYIKVVSSTV